jgi:CHAT domain-containing protein
MTFPVRIRAAIVAAIIVVLSHGVAALADEPAAAARRLYQAAWRVGSARAETLLTTFYNQWMKHPHQPFAKARALREARLALLRDPGYHHPYYWSPFVLIGSAD